MPIEVGSLAFKEHPGLSRRVVAITFDQFMNSLSKQA